MYIRLFAISCNKDEAIHIFNNVISEIKNNNIRSQEIVKNEPYWKIDGVYVVEVDLELASSFSNEQIEVFLYSIADKWVFFGNPINEALASDTTEGCNYLKNGIKMINIIY